MSEYIPSPDQSTKPEGDHVQFHVHVSRDGRSCLMDVSRHGDRPVNLRLEFGRSELHGLVCTLNAMLGVMR
jgi:hypothetical protein